MSDDTLKTLITNLPAILTALALFVGALVTALAAIFKKVAAVQVDVKEVHQIVNSNTTKMMNDLEAVRDTVTRLTGEKEVLAEKVREGKGDNP